LATNLLLARCYNQANLAKGFRDMNRILPAALISLSIAACASTPTVYGPAIKASAPGYREQRIETERYRITFRANADLKGRGAEDNALRRAAEIARRDGYDWFRVVNRSTEQVGGREGGGTSLGVGGSSGRYGSSVGVGIGFDLSPDSRQWDSTLEILLGKGAKPPEPDAYDARSVLAH
jgi:hypothetical protein